MRPATPEDLHAVNAVLNHPGVRPMMECNGSGDMNLSTQVSRWQTYVDEGSVVLAEPLGFGVYLGIVTIVPEARGIRGAVFQRRVLDYMFTHTDAIKVMGTIAQENMKSIRNMIGLGFISTMPTRKDRSIVSLDWINWALGSRACRDAGLAFARPRGLVMPDDEAHVLGAFLLTVKNSGEWTKALSQFNTWAGCNRSRRLSLIHDGKQMFKLGPIAFSLGTDIE